jgi:hypothetical protein
MVYIKRAFSESADPRQQTANQVNVTIFLISLMYLLSALIYSCCMFVEIICFQFKLVNGIFQLLMLSRYTLPLVNAALFPTILILRKPDLRARYRGYISALFRSPLTIFYKIRHRAGGNTEI